MIKKCDRKLKKNKLSKKKIILNQGQRFQSLWIICGGGEMVSTSAENRQQADRKLLIRGCPLPTLLR